MKLNETIWLGPLLVVLLAPQAPIQGATIYARDTSGSVVQAALKSAKQGDTIIASNSVVTTNSITSTVVMSKPVTLLFKNTHWLDDVADTGSDSTRAMIRMDTSPGADCSGSTGLK